MVTSAHRVEVEVGADGPASAPLSGAAGAALPAGAERLHMLHGVHVMVRTVMQLHKGDMQARSKPSTAPHFVCGDKVRVVTKSLFLRGQRNRKLRDRQLGPFTIEEQIGKHI
jgi:hypothetical protein